jgi:hypothetical protein
MESARCKSKTKSVKVPIFDFCGVFIREPKIAEGSKNARICNIFVIFYWKFSIFF